MSRDTCFSRWRWNYSVCCNFALKSFQESVFYCGSKTTELLPTGPNKSPKRWGGATEQKFGEGCRIASMQVPSSIVRSDKPQLSDKRCFYFLIYTYTETRIVLEYVKFFNPSISQVTMDSLKLLYAWFSTAHQTTISHIKMAAATLPLCCWHYKLKKQTRRIALSSLLTGLMCWSLSAWYLTSWNLHLHRFRSFGR